MTKRSGLRCGLGTIWGVIRLWGVGKECGGGGGGHRVQVLGMAARHR